MACSYQLQIWVPARGRFWLDFRFHGAAGNVIGCQRSEGITDVDFFPCNSDNNDFAYRIGHEILYE